MTMDKRRLEIIIIAVLVLVFLFAWANTFNRLKNKKPPQAPPAAMPTLVSQGPVPSEAESEDEDDRMKWVRDPFSGKTYPSGESKISDLRCSGIVWDQEAPVAMINDRMVKAGDRVSGATVVEIKPDRVILDDGNREFEIKVK